ncbi:MAG TPA: ABC-F family ATP-binding cassette domain-containing protein [Candidatus Microsaccharimonas sp.]|nr:ABC-F family ATP-binding cassette domain-containing protein [Candidatus Microsaccharimonas sp.]
MLLSIDISEKSFGDKLLYTNLRFDIQPGEKIGLVGRNGTGKSTLLHMITGDDVDYQGTIDAKRGTVVIASRQEHHGHEDKAVLGYIQGDLPEFEKLHHIITTYPHTMGDDVRKLQTYGDALDRFSQLGYFQIEDELGQAFESYQLDPTQLESKLRDLSGGQKRMVELIKVQRARGDIALIDEPTNHMDYVAKKAFIKWLTSTQEAVMVITHDRDVLEVVDRIIEIRDGRAYAFRGNYDQYLKTNTGQITSQVNEYDLTQKRIRNLNNDLIRFRRMKEKARDPGTIKRFKGQEEKVEAELAKLSLTEKPSFWIDRENADDMTPKMADAYQKYKARNIQLSAKTEQSRSSRLLVEARNLSLGYGDTPLFTDVNFSLHEGERLRLHGRNGAGKTTLINTIMAKVHNTPSEATVFGGTIAVEKELKLGYYQQEIDAKYLPLKLKDAIEQACMDKDVPASDRHTKQLLSQYLFDPISDGETPIERLSGGQKARFQLIRMLLDEPLILVLDEPTNHLDLPSIEELEDALAQYHGAVIYISHDSIFAKKVGGETVEIGPSR